MSRPKGTDNTWRAKKKTLEEFLKTEQWINKNLDKARETIANLMDDKDAPHTVRRGAAETIISLHKQFYRHHGGKAEYSEPEGKKSPTNEEYAGDDTEDDADIIDFYFNGTKG